MIKRLIGSAFAVAAIAVIVLTVLHRERYTSFFPTDEPAAKTETGGAGLPASADKTSGLPDETVTGPHGGAWDREAQASDGDITGSQTDGSTYGKEETTGLHGSEAPATNEAANGPQSPAAGGATPDTATRRTGDARRTGNARQTGDAR